MQRAQDLPIASTDLVPDEAYLFFPREKEIRKACSRGIERIIFGGSIEYDEVEKKHIRNFTEEIQKKHSYQLPPGWTDEDTLKFLQANQFKYKKAYTTMIEYIEWMKSTLPVKLTTTIEQYLQKGIVYLFGRDCRMRPILVMNGHLMNPKYIDIDTFIQSLTFTLSYMINELFLPGQIENWHVIGDLNGCGITDLPISALKKIFMYLQSNYRSRLYKLHIFNAPNSIVLPWKMARGFVEDSTREKLHFCKASTSVDLWKEINPSQVEERFGGKAPNLKTYWPLTPSPNDYKVKDDSFPESFISKETYYKMYKEGKLQGHKVSESIIKLMEQEEKERPELDIEADVIMDRKKSPNSQPESISELPQVDHYDNNDDFSMSYGLEEKTQLHPTVNIVLTRKPIICGNYETFENSPTKIKRNKSPKEFKSMDI